MLITRLKPRNYLTFKDRMCLQIICANRIDIIPCSTDAQLTKDLGIYLRIPDLNNEDYYILVFIPVLREILLNMNANGKSKRYWIHVFQHADLNIFDYVKQK